MKPEEPSNSQSGMSLSQQGPSNNTPTNPQTQQHQEAAAQIIRNQINSLYDNSENQTEKPVDSQELLTPIEDIDPYQKTHSEKPNFQTNDWNKYHTAWQNYYQKYYEGYYSQHLEKLKNSPKTNNSSQDQQLESKPRIEHSYFANQNRNQTKPDDTISTETEVFDIRQELISKVNSSAKKVRKSRHFIPLFSGIVVVLIFVFLQYNRLIISNVMAYVSPGNIDPQNIVVNPNAEVTVGPEPKLIIPKINVDVPVTYDIGNDYNSQMAAMTNGVAQFAIPGADSHPGQIGNTVIAGHSSNDLLDGGDYKFIFAQLDKLNIGDTIYANYNSKRYTYTVTKKEVVKPNEVSKLVYPTTKPILTLLTCTPVGTSLNRLLVTAEQVNPDPTKSSAAPVSNKSTTKSIPGNSPTLLERLFGSNSN
jgi:sortase A